MKKMFAFFSDVRYAFLSGWQFLPDFLPSDLDLIIPEDMLPVLEQNLVAGTQWRLVNHLRHESTCDYFVVDISKNDQIEFLLLDTATDYRRDGHVWFNADELLKERRKWKGFWVAGPEVEFKYLLVKKILKQALPSHAGARLQTLAEELRPKSDEMACRLLGARWGVRVMDWIRAGEGEVLEAHFPTLKRVLKWERLKQDPLNPLRYWLPEFRRIWQRWRHPTGLWVAMMGPDGSGKSTLIASLERGLKRAFRRTALFHLMLGILRKRVNGGPVTGPHGEPPRPFFVSMLKLLYYWLDYNLGYWLKVRPALVRSTLVLFDRYYDDLFIDPRRYRYGGPLGLARWLRRFIPRPDVYLVLDVPVEELLERKREVSPEELRRQVKAYREFALETPNAFLLDGSLPAGEVAQDAREVLLDVLQARYLDRRKVWFPRVEDKEEGDYLEKSLGLRLSKGHPTHAYLRLPDGRGYLLPLRSGSAFRKGLQLYPAQGRKARFGKTVLDVLARSGVKGPGLLRVGFEEREDAIFRTLREVFGRDDLCFAVSLGTPGPHRKPVVQVLTPKGEVLGYAKVGWNEATRGLVIHEAEVLRRLGKEQLPFGIPALIYAGEIAGRSIGIQSPPPKDVRPAPRQWTSMHTEALCALALLGVRYKPLEQTAFWQRIVARVRDVRNPYRKRVLEQTMEKVRRDWEGKDVPLHPAHGDFSPWNILQANGHLYIYDWEYALEEAPAGFDMFYFIVQRVLLLESQLSNDALKGLREISEHTLEYWDMLIEQDLPFSSGSFISLFAIYSVGSKDVINLYGFVKLLLLLMMEDNHEPKN